MYNYDPYFRGYNPYNKVNNITDYSDVSRGFVTQSNGSAYTYDVDGNMTADPNKGITGITYNHLNLPTVITFTGNRTITFLYDAGGNKLRKTVNNNGTLLYTQDYVNGIEYKNGALEAIYHSEGRVTTIDGTLKYEYAMKDHLGNTRLMFCDRNGDGVIKPENAPEASEVTQENSYYAFGMNMEFGAWENTPSVTDNLHQYNGKELNTDFGLNWNDYGARFYDPATARWNVIDPMAEKYMSYNPYNYGKDNPVRFIDPTGMKPLDWLFNGQDDEYLSPDEKLHKGQHDDNPWNGGFRPNYIAKYEASGSSKTSDRNDSSNKGEEICPTCPNSGALEQYKNDPNNLYTYDSENGIIFNGDKTAVVYGKGPEKEKGIGQKMAEGAALASDVHNTTVDVTSTLIKDAPKVFETMSRFTGGIGGGLTMVLAGNDIYNKGINLSNGSSLALGAASVAFAVFCPECVVLILAVDIITTGKDIYDAHEELRNKK